MRMSTKPDRHPPAKVSSPGWRSVILVCGDCKKRGGGAPKLKTKAAVAEARRAMSGRMPKVRVIRTTCLGLCPKRALAIAWAGEAESLGIVAVTTAGDLATALPVMARLRD